MAYFSDRFVSLNKIVLAAAVIYAGAMTFAHAAQTRENDRVDVYHSCLSITVDGYWDQHHNDQVPPTQAEMNGRAEKCSVFLRQDRN
jgi:hypothetical protein